MHFPADNLPLYILTHLNIPIEVVLVESECIHSLFILHLLGMQLA